MLDTSAAIPSPSLADIFIGLVGFEPTACRRGDRATATRRVPLFLFRFCNIVRVVPPRSDWQSFRCGLSPTAVRVSSLWIRRCYGAECAQLNFRKNRRSAVRFSRCATRNNETFFDYENSIGLVGFEPTASWSRTRRSTKLSHSPKWNRYASDAALTSRILVQIARRSNPWSEARCLKRSKFAHLDQLAALHFR